MKRIAPLLLVLMSAPAWAQWKEEKPAPGGWESKPQPQPQPQPQPKNERNGGWGEPPATSVPAPSGEHGRIYVAYGPTSTDFGRGMEQGLRESGGFEQLARALDSLFSLPRDLPIVMTDCGVINLFYDPQRHRIVVCYEFMSHLAELARIEGLSFSNDSELGRWIGNVTVFGLFHEFGHALIGELELPSTGREEDAVDEFASILLSQVGDAGQMAALSGASWFKMEDDAKRKNGVSNPYWDEHSFDLQRMVTVVCILLGSNPDKYKPIADSIDIPPEREQRCMIDYPKKDKAWQTLLGPHLRRR